MRAIFVVISLFAAALIPTFGQESQTAAAQALVEGSVVNKVSGAPVKQAHVMFLRLAQAQGDDFIQTYVDTDAGGHYSARLSAGQYRISVERPGFSRSSYGASSPLSVGKTVSLAPGQELQDLSFRISPLGAISGHVLDEDGDPIQGAGVQVLKFSYATGKRQLVPLSGTTSNDRGEYRAFGLPPGRYFLLVTRPASPLSNTPQPGLMVPDMRDSYAPMYYPGVLDFNSASPIVLAEGADAGEADVRVERVRVVSLRGRVLSPVANFLESRLQIALAPRDGGAGLSVNPATPVIDRQSGVFEFHNVPPGSYLLVASQIYRGHVLSGRLSIEVTAARLPDEISIPLSAGSDIAGTVEADGAADLMKGTRVTLTDSEGLAAGAPPSAPVEPGGGFRLTDVSVGVWDVSLSPVPKRMWVKSILLDGREMPGGTLDLTGSPRAVLRILLSTNAAQLSGKVLRDGQPSRATVVLVPLTPELPASASNYPSVSADDQGNYTFSGVRPGAYKLFAFEDTEPYAWLDPDFLKTVESQGEEITLGEGDDVKKQVTAITTDTAAAAP